MGWLSKTFKKIVKVATLGAVDLQKKKDEERRAKQQQAALEAETKRAQQNAEQAGNRYRQESSDLASLTEQADFDGGEMAGILTSADGLSKDKRKLGNKKKLGG